MHLTQPVVLLLGILCVKAAPGSSGQAFFRNTVPAAESLANNNTQWDLSAGPPSNSSSNFIFATFNSFLQHWPNTKYRNGHNLVPGVIPVGSLLYHGTFRNQTPNTPEWTATDPEHSYVFCRSLESDTGCWHLTLAVTRPLKVLYFDGSSAAKMNNGPMDSQDLVVWKEVKPEWAFREGERIARLCDWGSKYGIDGFVRMEMDFEVMLCNFRSGVEVVSFLNLIPAAPVMRRPKKEPLASHSRHRDPLDDATSNFSHGLEAEIQPPTDGPKGPFSTSSTDFRIMEAGSWHNHFPGDPRFRLDYSRIISFYDPVLFPSLQAARQGQARLDHRLDKISQVDVDTLFSQLDKVLEGWQGLPAESGVDWQNIIRVITNRYAERLEILHYILNSTSTTYGPLKMAYRHLSSMVAPYTLFSAVPPSSNYTGEDNRYSWASPVYELCATTHTKVMEIPGLASKLTHSEHLLLGALKDVTKEICRVVVGLWAEGREAGLDPDPEEVGAVNEIPAPHNVTAEDWKERVEALMKWLDWSYWLRCRPACSYEEMCYLPTWPWFLRRQPRSIFLRSWIWRNGRGDKEKSDSSDAELIDDQNQEEWVDPQPRCVRRVEPVDFWDTWGPQ